MAARSGSDERMRRKSCGSSRSAGNRLDGLGCIWAAEADLVLEARYMLRRSKRCCKLGLAARHLLIEGNSVRPPRVAEAFQCQSAAKREPVAFLQAATFLALRSSGPDNFEALNKELEDAWI